MKREGTVRVGTGSILGGRRGQRGGLRRPSAEPHRPHHDWDSGDFLSTLVGAIIVLPAVSQSVRKNGAATPISHKRAEIVPPRRWQASSRLGRISANLARGATFRRANGYGATAPGDSKERGMPKQTKSTRKPAAKKAAATRSKKSAKAGAKKATKAVKKTAKKAATKSTKKAGKATKAASKKTTKAGKAASKSKAASKAKSKAKPKAKTAKAKTAKAKTASKAAKPKAKTAKRKAAKKSAKK